MATQRPPIPGWDKHLERKDAERQHTHWVNGLERTSADGIYRRSVLSLAPRTRTRSLQWRGFSARPKRPATGPRTTSRCAWLVLPRTGHQGLNEPGIGALGACVVVVYAYLGIAVLTAICWLVGYIVHLRFGRFVLRETKDAASLKHAAEFARGYRSANFKSVSDAATKLAQRGRRSIELAQGLQDRSGSGVRNATAPVALHRHGCVRVPQLVGRSLHPQSGIVHNRCDGAPARAAGRSRPGWTAGRPPPPDSHKTAGPAPAAAATSRSPALPPNRSTPRSRPARPAGWPAPGRTPPPAPGRRSADLSRPARKPAGTPPDPGHTHRSSGTHGQDQPTTAATPRPARADPAPAIDPPTSPPRPARPPSPSASGDVTVHNLLSPRDTPSAVSPGLSISRSARSLPAGRRGSRRGAPGRPPASSSHPAKGDTQHSL